MSAGETAQQWRVCGESITCGPWQGQWLAGWLPTDQQRHDLVDTYARRNVRVWLEFRTLTISMRAREWVVGGPDA